MGNIKLQKFVYLFILLCISVFVIICTVPFGQNYALFEDDFVFSVYKTDESIFDCLNFSYGHGGGYIGYFFSKLFSFWLPNKLGIHPCDFVKINLAIKGVFTVITLLLISNFSQLYKKSQNIYLFSYAMLAFCYFFFNFRYPTLIYGVSYNYYRYSFSLIFLSIFIYYLYKYCTNKEHILKKELIISSICAFVIGTSSEIVFIFSLFLISVVFVLRKVYLKLDKYFYVPAASLVLAVVLFTSSPGFKYVSDKRGLGENSFDLNMVVDFFKEFFSRYIVEEVTYWIVFLFIIFIALYFAKKEQEIPKLVFPFLVLIGILFSIFSLIFCGRTFYVNNDFWLIHAHIRFLFDILLCIPLLIFISYISSKISVLKTMFMFFVLFVISVIYFSFSIKTVNDFNLKAMDLKVKTYQTEKIFRFYYLKNELPYLPIYLHVRDIYRFELPKNEECLLSEKNSFFSAYYPNIYKDNNIANISVYCVGPDAIEKFEQNGGAFSKEELADIKFSRLFDDNFVLNKKTQN